MNKNLLKLTLGLSLLVFSNHADAQCPQITCVPDITANTDSAMCDAIVTYTIPSVTDSCGLLSSQVFNYTGAQQTFTVPAGVTSIIVDAYGAQGGSNSPSTNINYGGYVQATLAVTPGSTIYVNVGEQPNGLTGGWNGGGNGETAGKGGGGASDIRIGGTTLNDRMVVAGGAGGGGFWSSQEVYGGIGGGLIGGNGYRTDYVTAPGGEGGTQTSSGNGTCASLNNPICTGGFGYGGAPSGCGCEGYGGGGGWYGGAGSGNCRGGGGGSSYTIPSATNVTHTQGVRTGHGEVTISWVGNITTPTVTQIAGLPSGSVFPIGTTINTFVAENQGGLDTCSFAVTIVDAQIPTISCSGDIVICEGEAIPSTSASTSDNCTGETVSYTLSGATSGFGAPNVDNVQFNIGTTLVTYTVMDAAGNQDSCSFNVTVNALPTVSLASFSVDTLCDYNPAIALPAGTPASGTYSGAGVSGTNFDPAQANQGYNWVIYTYTDSSGCANSDTSSIYVDGCASLEEGFLNSEISVYPNPTNGLVTVSFENFEGSLDFILTTLDGKVILRELDYTNASISIDLTNEPKGVYLIHVENGQAQHTLKLVRD